MVSNVRGKRGKKKLDPVRVDKIKEATFKLWPLEGKEDAWSECKRAIDERGRQLNLKEKLLDSFVHYSTCTDNNVNALFPLYT